MKKIFSVLLISMMILTGSVQLVFAEMNPVTGDAINQDVSFACDLNSGKITLNKKVMNVKRIRYDGMNYFTLNDAVKYFDATLKMDEKTKSINILTVKDPKAVKPSAKKLTAKKGQTINAVLNAYTIRVDGLNEYINNILYQNEVYVPARYFSDIFNKTIQEQKDGTVTIKDRTDVILGTVDGEKITQYDMDYYFNSEVKNLTNLTAQELEEQKKLLKQEIFNYLVDQKIKAIKAKQNKIVLDQAELDAINTNSLDYVIKSFNGTVNFRKIIKIDNVTLHQVIQDYRQVNVVNKLFTKLTSAVSSTEAEIQKFYDENKANIVVQGKSKVNHILIATNDMDATQKETAKKQLEDILSRINKGEDFITLMQLYSEDPGSKDLPDGFEVMQGASIDPAFLEAALALKTGEVSAIVESQFGYHIIKALEVTPEKQLTLEEAKDNIKSQLDGNAKRTYFNDLFTEWKAKSKIVNKMK